MLHHIHVEHGIELLIAGRECLGARQPIVEIQAAPLRVQFRAPDLLWRDVDTRNVRVEPRHGLAQDATAAANIQQPQALQRVLGGWIGSEGVAEVLANVPNPERIEFVQWPERPVGVPPAMGQLLVIPAIEGLVSLKLINPASRGPARSQDGMRAYHSARR